MNGAARSKPDGGAGQERRSGVRPSVSRTDMASTQSLPAEVGQPSDAAREPAVELAPGTVIGRYVVKGPIGRGGMGVVYEVYDPQLDRRIAIKLLATAHADSPRLHDRTRLLREAQAMARLSHPNVVAVYDVGTFGEQVFVAMERVDGITLAAWQAQRPRSWQEVLAAYRQAGAGLAAAHAAGLVHRDFKPENVLVDRQGCLHVLDFGLARAADPLVERPHPEAPEDRAVALADTIAAGAVGSDTRSGGVPAAESRAGSAAATELLLASLTATGALLGTPGYMSPEQFLCLPLDARTDQFSFCVALYEGLYGRRPFAGETLIEIGMAVTQGEVIEPPRGTRIPERVRKAVLRGLRPLPAERFPSMDALLAELSTARGPSRRAVIAGAAAAAVLGAGGVLALGRRRAPAAPVSYRQLTFTGQAKWPAFSPDGRRLAYVSGSEVRIRDLASGVERGVDPEAPFYELHWFSASEVALLDARGGVVLVPSDGGPVQRIPYERARSPDGSRTVLYGTSCASLTLLDTASGRETALPLRGCTQIEDAVWSPVADVVLVQTSHAGKVTFWAVTLDGTTQEQLASEVQAGSPRWAPAGDAFYYLRGRDELMKVRLDARGTGALGPPLALLTGLDADPVMTISRDGRTLVYARGGVRANVWVVDIAAEGSKRVRAERITGRSGNRSALSVSPDGKLIAFGQVDASGNVFVVGVDGGAQRRVNSAGDLAEVERTAWSPDGREIAFTGRGRDGTTALYRVPAGGGSPAALLSPVSAELAWGPDGRILVQAIDNQNFVVLEPASGLSRPLLPAVDRWVSRPRVSADGKTAAVFWNHPPSGIWLVSLDSGAARSLAPGTMKPVAFSPDGASLFALKHDTGPRPGPELLSIAVATGAVTPLARLPFESGAGQVVLVPGTSRFACLVDEPSSDLWAAEGFDPEVEER